VHVWRRDPPCAQRCNKEYLLNSPLTTESSTPAFHGIRRVGEAIHEYSTLKVVVSGPGFG